MGHLDQISVRLVIANATAGVVLGGLFAALAYDQIASLGAEDIAVLDRQIRQHYQDETKSLTDAVVSAIGHYRDRAASGELSLEEAQRLARQHLASISYADGGYFWAHTYDPKAPTQATMIAHPISALDGRDISENRYSSGSREGEVVMGWQVDALGRRIPGKEAAPLFQQMNRLVAASGGGHVNYEWPRKGDKTYIAKVSYVALVPEWNWVVGTGMYIDDVDKAVAVAASNVEARISGTISRLLMTMAVVTISAVLIALYMGRWLRRRVSVVIQRLRDIAEGDGDLTQRLDATSQDSLGELAEWFNTFVSRIQSMLQGVAESSAPLQNSVLSLNSISSTLAGTTEEIRSQSQSVASSMHAMRDRLRGVAGAADNAAGGVARVAAANEELSSNALSLSGSVDALSGNLGSIVTAIEEMNTSLNEVSHRCADSAEASRRSSDIAEDAKARMATLFEAAKRIGKVVELIEDIADQTNLLALNATIEAASAGDAGRGFAVVANEVKALAKQTANATEEIAQQMSAMLQETDLAMKKIQEVTEHSQEVTNLSSMIAAAVEQQSATTHGISDNVQQSADRAHEMALAVEEMSSGVGELTQQAAEVSKSVDNIARDVQAVASGAEEIAARVTQFDGALSKTASNAHQVTTAASGMKSVATRLSDMVARFTV